MRKHIENAINQVKTKPPRTRDQVAFGVALGVAILLFGIWTILFSYRIRKIDSSATTRLMNQFGSLATGLSDAFKKVQSGQIYDTNEPEVKQKDQAIPIETNNTPHPTQRPYSGESVAPLTEN